MLIAQWQYGVTRKDMAEAFSFKDFKEVQVKVIRHIFSSHLEINVVWYIVIGISALV